MLQHIIDNQFGFLEAAELTEIQSKRKLNMDKSNSSYH